MSKPAVAEGDVVLIRARVRRTYDNMGLVVVRIATPPGCEGGRPGFQQVPIAALAVESVSADTDDDTMVPGRFGW